MAAIHASRRISLLGAHEIDFDPATHLILHRRRSLPYHANGMTLFAYDELGAPLLEKTYYSVGGGFVVDEDAVGEDRIKPDDTALRHPFRTGDEAAAAVPRDRSVHLRADAGERAGLAQRGRDPHRAAGDLGRDAGVRTARHVP